LGKNATVERCLSVKETSLYLRHSIAVVMLCGGADIRHVQALLGHSSIETMKIYLRMVPGHLREEYDKAMPTIVVHGLPPAAPESSSHPPEKP
jgi:integrase/recombinase XerD